MEHFVWNADPIAFSIGGMRVFWYGILFATAILSGLEMMKWFYRRENKDLEQLDTLFLYIVVGIVLGARLAHCFLYEPSFYLAHPLEILYVWKGGLASHGGTLGVIIAIYLYTKKYKVNLLWLLDRVAIASGIFAFFVRLGNFMNSEILGHVTNVPWAIVFIRIDEFPRHPVQLYEAFSYLGITILLLFIYRRWSKCLNDGFLFGLFLAIIFGVRFLLEFVKERQAEYSADLLFSTGQFLSIPFVLVGLYFIYRSMKKA
jgi:phosphatidylglycerol---prolipoprotein diacylglyceryl transferase